MLQLSAAQAGTSLCLQSCDMRACHVLNCHSLCTSIGSYVQAWTLQSWFRSCRRPTPATRRGGTQQCASGGSCCTNGCHILPENYECCTGLDSAELVSQLRAAHASDSSARSGVDVIAGRVGDMQELGIFEAFKVLAVSLSAAPWRVAQPCAAMMGTLRLPCAVS